MERHREPSTQVGRGGLAEPPLMWAADVLPVMIENLRNGPRRWPVLRCGERDELPWFVRLAVARRDNFCCRHCHRDLINHPFELDHIKPWSAGGLDDSTNLRVLCVPCNQRRSNFVDWSHRRVATPCTWWCIECWSGDNPAPRRIPPAANGLPNGLDDNSPLGEPTIWAFCAHCGHLSWTDRTI